MTESVTYSEIRKAIRAIPYGTVRTHSDLAAELGTTPMQVGKAMWYKAGYSQVPWWRVVPVAGLSSKKGQYHGESEKEWLLAHIALLLGEGVKLSIQVVE